MNFSEKYNHFTEVFEKQLNALMSSLHKVPEPLLSAMKYSIEAGGKRLRPVLTLSAAELLGGSLDNAMPYATAIELVHTYSLIHDDLPCMDNDDLRRGKPTNHKVFGEGMAVLAGDALLNLAYEVLFRHISKHNFKYNITAAQIISEAAGSLGMIAGQCADLKNQDKKNPTQEDLYYVHSHKTGCLISAAISSGAYSANADKNSLERLDKFAEKLGMLFQITDDILDVTGNSATLGKSTGKDAEQNKLTYIKVFGLDKSNQIAREYVEKIEEILLPFGDNADFFRKLARSMIGRIK